MATVPSVDAELSAPTAGRYVMGMPLGAPTYTVDQLEQFPNDGNRYELLDGLLLVTPAPTFGHQAIVQRLAFQLQSQLPFTRAVVVSPGAVEIRPKTHLEPDILVVPARYPRSVEWNDIREWWLAVEVLSRSSRVYDRDFKRDAYLAIGVQEVWLVDWREECVWVSRREGPRDRRVESRLEWTPPDTDTTIGIDLAGLFAG